MIKIIVLEFMIIKLNLKIILLTLVKEIKKIVEFMLIKIYLEIILLSLFKMIKNILVLNEKIFL